MKHPFLLDHFLKYLHKSDAYNLNKNNLLQKIRMAYGMLLSLPL